MRLNIKQIVSITETAARGLALVRACGYSGLVWTMLAPVVM